MIDGIITPDWQEMDEVMPHAPYPIYPGGLRDEDKSHVRYALPSIQSPTLTIVDYIYAEDGTPVIAPGHYTLEISENKDMLLLIQAYDVIARIPVFLLEEDETESQKQYDKKEQKKAKKEKKKREKIQKKYDEFGVKAKPAYVYSNAEIEFVPDKCYYLFKYEKGPIRAWGAIKQLDY
ncbi:hypothetical protein IJ707_01100 [bacterium]|nr:hypothetical protein [bacterium]